MAKQASWEPEAGEQRWRYYCIKMGMRLLCGQSTMRGRGIKKRKGTQEQIAGGEDSRRFEDYKQLWKKPLQRRILLSLQYLHHLSEAQREI